MLSKVNDTMCIYVCGRFFLNVCLASEYTFLNSFLKSNFRICSRIYVSSCLDLKTATFKMEVFVATVNGFHVLNVAS